MEIVHKEKDVVAVEREEPATKEEKKKLDITDLDVNLVKEKKLEKDAVEEVKTVVEAEVEIVAKVIPKMLPDVEVVVEAHAQELETQMLQKVKQQQI